MMKVKRWDSLILNDFGETSDKLGFHFCAATSTAAGILPYNVTQQLSDMRTVNLAASVVSPEEEIGPW